MSLQLRPPGTAAPVLHRVLTLAIGFGVSGLLLALVIAKTDIREAVDRARSASVLWLGLALLTKLSVVFVKRQRWGLLVSQFLPNRPRRMLRALLIGYFGNAVLPAKAGEVLRIQSFRKNNDGAAFSSVLASVVLERSIDGLVLVALFFVASSGFPLPPWVKGGALVTSTLTGALFVAILIMSRYFTLGQRVRGRVGSFLQRILTRFREGLKAARSPGVLLGCAGLTLGAWLVEVTGTYFALRAFAIDVSWLVGLIVVVVVAIGGAVPAVPAGLGTHQFLYLTCLGWFGVAAEKAVGASVVTVFMMTTAFVLLGMVSLWADGWTFRGLWRQGTLASAAAEGDKEGSEQGPAECV